MLRVLTVIHEWHWKLSFRVCSLNTDTVMTVIFPRSTMKLVFFAHTYSGKEHEHVQDLFDPRLHIEMKTSRKENFCKTSDRNNLPPGRLTRLFTLYINEPKNTLSCSKYVTAFENSCSVIFFGCNNLKKNQKTHKTLGQCQGSGDQTQLTTEAKALPANWPVQ